MRQESGRIHFKSNGLPTYGPPNGFGLMQLDNPAATELQMWNWKANLFGGVNLYLTEKKPIAIAHVKHLFGIDNPKDEKVLMEAWQRYNGGKYWDKVKEKDGTITIKKVAFDKNGKEIFHSEKCLNFYKQLGCY